MVDEPNDIQQQTPAGEEPLADGPAGESDDLNFDVHPELYGADQVAILIPNGVRILAPTGELGTVPKEHLEEALEAGARVMNPDDMRQLRQEVFMQHEIFKSEHKRPTPGRRRRRSIMRGLRRR